MKILAEHFWSRYYIKVRNWVFIPWLIYFFLTLTYITLFSVQGVDRLSDSQQGAEIVMRFIILLQILYFIYFEFVSVIRDGTDYLYDIYNWIDISSFIINIFLIYATIYIKPYDGDRTVIRVIGSIAVILLWFKAFYWMRLFTETSFYVRLIKDTIYDLRYFLILFIFILITFANALLVLNQQRTDMLYKDFFNFPIFDSILN